MLACTQFPPCEITNVQKTLRNESTDSTAKLTFCKTFVATLVANVWLVHAM